MRLLSGFLGMVRKLIFLFVHSDGIENPWLAGAVDRRSAPRFWFAEHFNGFQSLDVQTLRPRITHSSPARTIREAGLVTT